jgi:DNA-binding NarL/FixJ family response regulator
MNDTGEPSESRRPVPSSLAPPPSVLGMEGDAGAQYPPSLRSGGVRLLIIDPRSLSRDCLVAAIRHAGVTASVDAVPDVSAAIAAIRSGAVPDTILVNCAGEHVVLEKFLVLLAPLRQVAPVSGVLVLAPSIRREDVLAVLRQGITGLLDVDAPFDIVVQAINLIASGMMIYPALNVGSGLMIPGVRPMASADHLGLTSRQFQVLEQLQQGFTNSKIAAKLGVSERTVKAHLKEIMRRLGATNRTQVVALTNRGVFDGGSSRDH